MTCDELRTAILNPPEDIYSPEAQALADECDGHVEGCADCRLFFETTVSVVKTLILGLDR